MFVVYSIQSSRPQVDSFFLNFLCLLPMILKTRGLGIGATFMHGTELRLLAWLRERTVLVKSEHELHGNIQGIS